MWLLLGSLTTALATTRIAATVGSDTEVTLQLQPEPLPPNGLVEVRALRGPRLEHNSPAMRPVIDVVLGVYLLGALCSLLSLCHMVLRCVRKPDWRPFLIPVTAGFAFIPLGLAGLLVFRRQDGTCSYANSIQNFIIPISDLGSCGGRGYNLPELLTELVIVSAIGSCIYCQMLSRFFQRHFQGQYWPTMACHLIRSFGLLSMMGLVGVAVIPTYLSRLPHKAAAYVFFLASIWMLFLYSVLVLFLPPTVRPRFLCPAVLAVVLWSSMTIYGVLFTFSVCDRFCGVESIASAEPRGSQMERLMVEYNQYRWCLSIESVAEWLLVAFYAFWMLLAPVESTLEKA